jgi:hypothetical protein
MAECVFLDRGMRRLTIWGAGWGDREQSNKGNSSLISFLFTFKTTPQPLLYSVWHRAIKNFVNRVKCARNQNMTIALFSLVQIYRQLFLLHRQKLQILHSYFIIRNGAHCFPSFFVLSAYIRPPLWSSGQSSWLLNGDVVCFL